MESSYQFCGWTRPDRGLKGELSRHCSSGRADASALARYCNPPLVSLLIEHMWSSLAVEALTYVCTRSL